MVTEEFLELVDHFPYRAWSYILKNILAVILISISVSGCATVNPSIPNDYYGPRAIIIDSENRIDKGKADLFYLSHINGLKIKDSRSESLRASYQQGNNLTTVILETEVPSRKQIFTIVGRTEYAMPARAFVGAVYEVKGDISFTPAPIGKYVIKGTLGKYTSTVWIESVLQPDEIIGRIKAEGSSKLGFFKK
ncbi:MAG: hypothetical protein JKY67_00840 [Pseudomonadales bacterium]|nr:hypothetical protein [Pseudomonadales bacterium]